MDFRLKRGMVRSRLFQLAALAGVLLFGAHCGFAQAALLVEEPFGKFGSFTATGHAAVYLARVCAETPLKLRRCQPGENGVVISRYYDVGGHDWLAIPVVPYFYATDAIADVPSQVNAEAVAALREQYRRQHLLTQNIDGRNWQQLIGAAYDRKTYALEFATTEAQDDALIARLNSSPNGSHFSLLFNNCADFARSIVDFYHPHAVRRSLTADAGITTPKQIAKALVRYSRHDRELAVNEFAVEQVTGMPRSRPVRGVLESVLKSKKYVIPLAVFHPVIAASLAASYVRGGRFNIERSEQGEFQAGNLPMLKEAAPGAAAPAAGDGGQTFSGDHGKDDSSRADHGGLNRHGGAPER